MSKSLIAIGDSWCTGRPFKFPLGMETRLSQNWWKRARRVLQKKNNNRKALGSITIRGLSPAYLQNLFSIRGTPYNLRDPEIKLVVDRPKPRTNYLKRSFGYSGALLWNSLPANLRKLDSPGRFKREID